MIDVPGMKTTKIAAVEPRGTPMHPWWRIRDVDGQQYSTRNMWHAALCDRAIAGQALVRIWSTAGWYYRDLDEVRIVECIAKPTVNPL